MPRIERGSLILAGLLAVTLLLGIVIGVGLDRWALRPPHRGRYPAEAHRGDRLDPSRFRVRLSERLARELDLSTAQRAKVDSLLLRQQEDARGLMREMRPRLERLTDRTRDSLRVILTPEQLERWDRLRDRMGRRGGR